MNLKNKRIIISKINQIGDVTFALPIASALKKAEPSCTVIFLSREYTRSLIEHYADVDEFADWEAMNTSEQAAIQGLKALNADVILHIFSSKELLKAAKRARIPVRVASRSKMPNWFYCNRLVGVSRSKSPLHETQLDMIFLKALGVKSHYTLAEVIALQHYKPFEKTAECLALLDSTKFNLILHPKTRGEHIEWAPEKFAELIHLLPEDKFKIFVTGNSKEGDEVRAEMMEPFPQVIDLCGKISLNDLLQFIANADGMICASTGPVHLAANFGLHTLGLYAPITPFHAGRWGPVGPKVEILHLDKSCEACRHEGKCRCINEIRPQEVAERVLAWVGK